MPIEPRILPVSDAELTPAQAEALEPYFWGLPGNLIRTLLRKPEALARFTPWLRYFVSRHIDLQPRVREIVTLRTAVVCKSTYEWVHHVKWGKREGLTENEITLIRLGSRVGWSPAESVLIQAVDELHRDYFISDNTWSELREFYAEAECMDLVCTVAYYTQLSMMLNTFGVQLEEGLSPDPDFLSTEH